MRVHHITPGHSDKNFGKSINELVEFVPDEDWICLRDIDTLPLHHRAFFKQCEEIAERGDFDLIGCMTNRLGLKYQLHGGELSEDWDIKNHIKIAHERYEKHGSEVVDCDSTVAGVMMLFSKHTWEDIGRIPEGGVSIGGSFVDYIINERVRKIGGRIGIAPGIYLFHIYREWLENVRIGYNHIM
jgi:GT2 family glycosyltransferase